MTDVIAYATSDWHVPEEAGAGTWRDVPGVHGDVLYVLQQVVRLCVRDHVPLLAAGDLVDGPDMTPEALAAWFAVLRPLSDADLPVFYVRGNHERGRDWLAAFGPGAVCLDDKVVYLRGGESVSGLSFIHPSAFPAAAAALPKVTDIGLYHQAFADFGANKGMPLSTLPPHRLAVCGDTHISKAVRPAGGPALALSPGPLAPQSVSEFDTPGVWAVTSALSVRREEIAARRYVRYEINSPADADACVSALAGLAAGPTSLPPHLSTPMVAVSVRAELDGFVEAVRQAAATHGVALRVLDGTQRPSRSGPGDEVARPAASDLCGVLAAWPGLSPGARALALALADPSADPGEVLDADRAAWAAASDTADRFVETD